MRCAEPHLLKISFGQSIKRLLEVLYEDSRFDCDYDEKVKHSYSENYSYGRYGAYTDSGEAVSEPIDAIKYTLDGNKKINNLNL